MLAFRVSLVLDAADVGQRRRARRGLRGAAAILRDAPATPERDELVRRAGSRLFLDPVTESRLVARPARRRRRCRSRRRACGCPWTRRSATNGCCSRSRWRAASAGLATLDRVPARSAHARGAAHAACLGARAAESRTACPSGRRHAAPRGRSSWRWLRVTAGPEALAEVAGRVESRWIQRRLEPLKEKAAVAEITPEEMRELTELQALAAAPVARMHHGQAATDDGPLESRRTRARQEHELSGSQLLGLLSDSADDEEEVPSRDAHGFEVIAVDDDDEEEPEVEAGPDDRRDRAPSRARSGARLPARDRPCAAADCRRGDRAREAHRAQRPCCSPPADRGQPASGGLGREALRRPRHALPRPHPGRQHRPDARRREVRLASRLQVLDLRDVVDPPGDHARHRRPGAHDPRAGAHGGDDQQAASASSAS